MKDKLKTKQLGKHIYCDKCDTMHEVGLDQDPLNGTKHFKLWFHYGSCIKEGL